MICGGNFFLTLTGLAFCHGASDSLILNITKCQLCIYLAFFKKKRKPFTAFDLQLSVVGISSLTVNGGFCEPQFGYRVDQLKMIWDEES